MSQLTDRIEMDRQAETVSEVFQFAREQTELLRQILEQLRGEKSPLQEFADAASHPAPKPKTRGELIADGWRDGTYHGYADLAAAIDAELRAERERCENVIETTTHDWTRPIRPFHKGYR